MTRATHEKRTGKPCGKCGETLRYGRSYSCVKCTNERSSAAKKTSAYKKQAKVYWMGKRYGITPETFDAMFLAQGSVCGCCGATTPGNRNGWVLDHDHRTGKIRAVVCHGCNVGLGAFKDDAVWMAKAIGYLKRHATKGKL